METAVSQCSRTFIKPMLLLAVNYTEIPKHWKIVLTEKLNEVGSIL
jgi:hypothetical protein